MSTFTKLGTGKVIYEQNGTKFGFNPTMNVFPHPSNDNYILISNDDTNQDNDKAFPVNIDSITEPVFTNRNDLIVKLSELFFFDNNNSIIVMYYNRTGAPSIQGTIVTASGSYDDAVDINPANIPKPIGVIAVSGIANGALVPVIVCGKAYVLLQDNTAATRGYWAKVSDTQAGRADITNQFPPGGTIVALEDHGSEVGHCHQSVTASTNKLALCTVHFN